jgi:hypothetical protein
MFGSRWRVLDPTKKVHLWNGLLSHSVNIWKVARARFGDRKIPFGCYTGSNKIDNLIEQLRRAAGVEIAL